MTRIIPTKGPLRYANVNSARQWISFTLLPLQLLTVPLSKLEHSKLRLRKVICKDRKQLNVWWHNTFNYIYFFSFKKKKNTVQFTFVPLACIVAIYCKTGSFSLWGWSRDPRVVQSRARRAPLVILNRQRAARQKLRIFSAAVHNPRRRFNKSSPEWWIFVTSCHIGQRGNFKRCILFDKYEFLCYHPWTLPGHQTGKWT